MQKKRLNLALVLVISCLINIQSAFATGISQDADFEKSSNVASHVQSYQYSLADVPTEIMLMIAPHLVIGDGMALGLTCKKFLPLTYDSVLWATYIQRLPRYDFFLKKYPQEHPKEIVKHLLKPGLLFTLSDTEWEKSLFTLAVEGDLPYVGARWTDQRLIAIKVTKDDALKKLNTFPNEPLSKYVARGLSSDGTVVGWSAKDNSSLRRAVIWNRESINLLPTAQPVESVALGINRDHIIVGWLENRNSTKAVTWVCSNQTSQDLPVFDNTLTSKATAISDNGTIVGWVKNKDGFFKSIMWGGLESKPTELASLFQVIHSKAKVISKNGTVIAGFMSYLKCGIIEEGPFFWTKEKGMIPFKELFDWQGMIPKKVKEISADGTIMRIVARGKQQADSIAHCIFYFSFKRGLEEQELNLIWPVISSTPSLQNEMPIIQQMENEITSHAEVKPLAQKNGASSFVWRTYSSIRSLFTR